MGYVINLFPDNSSLSSFEGCLSVRRIINGKRRDPCPAGDIYVVNEPGDAQRESRVNPIAVYNFRGCAAAAISTMPLADSRKLIKVHECEIARSAADGESTLAPVSASISVTILCAPFALLILKLSACGNHATVEFPPLPGSSPGLSSSSRKK